MGRVSRQSAIAAALVLLTGANAQTSTAPEPTFKIDVKLVRQLVTVKNAAGDLIGSLNREDFGVTDNGVKQEIAIFDRQTAQPLSITLLIDTSFSTAKDLREERASFKKFLDALLRQGNTEDAASLYSFSGQVTLLNAFTRKVGRIEQSLDQLVAEPGTSMYDALYLSTSELNRREGRHVIVAVTDGVDTTSKKKYRDARQSVLNAEAVLYPIVIVPITNSAGRNTGGEHALETLAHDSGGRTFYPVIGPQLDETFDQILRDLRTQYLIGYYPKGVAAGRNTFHRLLVETPGRTDLHISTRTGYYEVGTP